MDYLVGIGTYMATDDSIGLRVAETISERGLERGFSAVEMGGNLLDLLHYFGPETGAMLIVDAARIGLAPGEYRFFGIGDVTTRKTLDGISTHEGDLMKVLEFARELGVPVPTIVLLGIEPADVSPQIGLSPALEGRFEEYVAAAVGHMTGPAARG